MRPARKQYGGGQRAAHNNSDHRITLSQHSCRKAQYRCHDVFSLGIFCVQATQNDDGMHADGRRDAAVPDRGRAPERR